MLYNSLRFLFPSNHLYCGQALSSGYRTGYWLYLIVAGILPSHNAEGIDVLCDKVCQQQKGRLVP